MIELIGPRLGQDEPGRMAIAINQVAYEQGIDTILSTRPTEGQSIIFCSRDSASFEAAHQYCTDANVPMLFMSSGLDCIPEQPTYPLVIAPNTSIPVLRFVRRVTDLIHTTKPDTVEIVEHHQPQKQDISGTALWLCRLIAQEPSIITPVRDWYTSSRAWGIPEAYRSGYAVHTMRAVYSDQPEFTDHIKEFGRNNYAAGALQLAQLLLSKSLQPGTQSVLNLLPTLENITRKGY